MSQYIAVAPEYEEGIFLGPFRVLAGGHVDLTGRFTDHADYVQQVTEPARALQESGYLLEAGADAIILRAIQSDIGSQARRRAPPARERKAPRGARLPCPL